MDSHAEGQEFGKASTLSTLDWPTPEHITAAHRLRGQALRDMTVALFRRLRGLFAEQLPRAAIGHRRPQTAKVRIVSSR